MGRKKEGTKEWIEGIEGGGSESEGWREGDRKGGRKECIGGGKREEGWEGRREEGREKGM